MIMHRFNCNHTVSKVVMTNTQLKNENSEEKRKNTKVSIELLKTFCLNWFFEFNCFLLSSWGTARKNLMIDLVYLCLKEKESGIISVKY